VVDTDRVCVTYANALACMAELRAMGETNALRERRRRFTRRATLLRAVERYRELAGGPSLSWFGSVKTRTQASTTAAAQATTTSCHLPQRRPPLEPVPVMVHPSALARLVTADAPVAECSTPRSRCPARNSLFGLWRAARRGVIRDTLCSADIFAAPSAAMALVGRRINPRPVALIPAPMLEKIGAGAQNVVTHAFTLK
jgi:hypothetical protein